MQGAVTIADTVRCIPNHRNPFPHCRVCSAPKKWFFSKKNIFWIKFVKKPDVIEDFKIAVWSPRIQYPNRRCIIIIFTWKSWFLCNFLTILSIPLWKLQWKSSYPAFSESWNFIHTILCFLSVKKYSKNEQKGGQKWHLLRGFPEAILGFVPSWHQSKIWPCSVQKKNLKIAQKIHYDCFKNMQFLSFLHGKSVFHILENQCFYDDFYGNITYF